MRNRREFLKATASGLIGVSAAGAAPLSVAGVHQRPPYYKVIYDNRFKTGVDFSNQAALRGAHTAAIQGDVTKLWYTDLYHLWREPHSITAGLTTMASFFCLEQFAQSVGYRVVFKAEHELGSRSAVHRLHADPKNGELALNALKTGKAWQNAIAETLAAFDFQASGPSQALVATTALTESDHEMIGVDDWVSWIIAPRHV